MSWVGLASVAGGRPQWRAPLQAWRRLPLVCRFIQQEEGVAAVEFGLVAAPFLALLFAILETALVFFAGQALETAAASGSRLILTGQAQTQGFDAARFKGAVCSRISGLFNCENNLHIDVQSYRSFAAIPSGLPIKDGELSNQFIYQPGGPGDIVLVRLMYEWPVHVSLVGLTLANMSGGRRLLMSTVAFRNEPYK